VAEGELARVVAAARAQVGAERLPKRRSDRDPIQLVGVETDLDRFRRLIVRASTADRVQAADDLAAAMGLLTGPPLGGVVAEWAEAAGLVDHLCELVEATTIRAIEAAIAADLVDRVPRLAMRGLVALPANEPIYRAYMKVAAEAGGPDLVGAVYDHLRRAIATQSPMEDRHPSEQTSRLRARLVEEAASGLAPSAARPSEQPSAPEPPRHPG
jgi:DNA-binding SARP family transcriptional activator